MTLANCITVRNKAVTARPLAAANRPSLVSRERANTTKGAPITIAASASPELRTTTILALLSVCRRAISSSTWMRIAAELSSGIFVMRAHSRRLGPAHDPEAPIGRNGVTKSEDRRATANSFIDTATPTVRRDTPAGTTRQKVCMVACASHHVVSRSGRLLHPLPPLLPHLAPGNRNTAELSKELPFGVRCCASFHAPTWSPCICRALAFPLPQTLLPPVTTMCHGSSASLRPLASL